jgi:hypothetical protein
MNTNIDAAYSTLRSAIQRYQEKVSAVKPEDEWQENVVDSLQSFFSEIEYALCSGKRNMEHYTSATPLQRFEEIKRVFSFISYFEGPEPENEDFDPLTFSECLSHLPEYIGEDETQNLCRIMNEIFAQMLVGE